MFRKKVFQKICLLAGLLLSGQVLADEKPLKSYPEPAQNRFNAGTDLQNQGKFQEALLAYQDAIKLGIGDYPKVYLKLATCYRKLNDPVKVIETYSRFMEDFGVERSCLF